MRKKAFQAAFPYTIPIFTGFWFLALAYGIYMNANGFPFVYPMLMSLLIYGGSLEFVAVEITKEPKTSRRTVSIPHFLTQRIKALRRERLKYRLTLGDYWQGGEWLFIQENGRQMGYSTPYSAFQDAITRYNADKPAAQQLPAIPFHGLRQYLGNPADCRETGCSDSIKPAWTRTGIHHEYLRPRIVGNRPQGVKCAGKYACGESAVMAEKAARSKNRAAFSAIKAGKILQ